MKLSLSFPLLWIYIFALLVPVSVLKAEGQEITIDLEQDKKNTAIYCFDEPIPIKVILSTGSDKEIYIVPDRKPPISGFRPSD